MQFKPHRSFAVQDRSHISYTKREVIKLAEAHGFDDNDKGKIEIILAELSSNIINIPPLRVARSLSGSSQKMRIM